MNEHEELLQELRATAKQMSELTQAIKQLAKSNEIMCDIMTSMIDVPEEAEELPSGIGGRRGEVRSK